MFCKYCGGQIDVDSIFCSKCGKKLDANQGAIAVEASVSEPSALVRELNGVSIDLVDLVYRFRLNEKHSDAIKATMFVKDTTKCDLQEAKDFVFNIKNDSDLLEKVKEIVITKAAARLKQPSSALCCPMCNCQNIHIDKKGYGLTKGVVGALVLGPLGLIAGKHKSNALRYTCVKCGHSWMQE